MTDRHIPEGQGAPLNEPDSFRRAGHQLVDEIADFFESLPTRPIRRPASVRAVRELIGEGPLPNVGTPLEELLTATAPLLFDHSVHNGHPRFFGYITASAAPIGALADMLAASVNSNIALWDLSPIASEIETQTIRWLAELVGFTSADSNECGGIMVSGGNMANMLAFLAARRAHASENLRTTGLQDDDHRMTAYCAAETHTWIQKAADISGLGTDAIRWIDTDDEQRMDMIALRKRLTADIEAGDRPFIIIGTAGTVSTAAIDPLPAIHEIAREFGAWFHVDGAYGAPAAVLPEAPPDLKGLALADSVALDPHKWLYAPLEAACTLVRDPQTLLDAFSYRPSYYRIDEHDEESGNDYYELGLQNSRGFRALKVWLALRNCGRSGYIELIRNDITRARELFDAAAAHAELEACTLNLSIATFRYVPPDMTTGTDAAETYLNELNEALLATLQDGGELYISNAVIGDKYVLRACVVNFRTTSADTAAVPEIVAAAGRRLDTNLRPDHLQN